MAHLESLVILDAARKSGAALAFGFERAGYRVYSTHAVDDALAMAQTRVAQLVVVAVEDVESMSFIGRLREEATTRELPVVGVGERARREEALRAGVDDFVTRPAFIRDVLTLSRLAVALRQDGDDGGGVVGLLEDYGLYFLVRAMAVAGRSGVLELERGRRTGEVHFVKGAVVAAHVGKMSGVTAFHHLLLWGEASMSLRFESPAAERRIAMSVEDLLASGVEFVREFEALAARVGGAQALYVHEPRRAAEARGKIPAEVMALIKFYDGHKPLIDIVEDSPFKAFDTIKITYRLAELGAITRRESRETTPLSAQLAVRDWLLGPGGTSAEAAAPLPADGAGVAEAARAAAELVGSSLALKTPVPATEPSAPVPATAASTPVPATEPSTPVPATAASTPSAAKAAALAATVSPPAPATVTTNAPAASAATPVAATTPSTSATASALAASVATPVAATTTAAATANTSAASAPSAPSNGTASTNGTSAAATTPAAVPTPAAATATAPAAASSPAATAPKATPTPAPATPAPATVAARSAKGKKNKRNKHKHGNAPQAVVTQPPPAAATKPVEAKAQPTPPAPAKAEPVAKPAEAKAEPVAKPAEAKAEPAAKPAEVKAEPVAAAKLAAKAAKPEAVEQPGKLSAQAAARAHAKEPVFDDVEEDFFARAADLHRVEDFSDLEHSEDHRKLSSRRNWFGFRKK